MAWRRAEAAARGVDEQVVLPGHCWAELVGVDGSRTDALASIKGFGEKRLARYGAALTTLLERDVAEPAPPDESEIET